MMFVCLDEKIPAWYRTPLAQTVVLGLVFLLLFTAYTTIQFYAASTYGSKLAANSVSTLYLTFASSCFLSPSVVNKWGSRQTMAIGIMGYVVFVVISLAYFYDLCSSRVVVLGGGMLGVGAALLWTAQGRLVLQYAAISEHIQPKLFHDRGKHEQQGQKSGTLLGIFRAIYQCGSLVGGTISFAYYYKATADASEESSAAIEKQTGSTLLYTIFLAFMILSALLTQILLPPSSMLPNKDGAHSNQLHVDEQTELLPASENVEDAKEDEELEILASDLRGEQESWVEEAKDTLILFTTNRPMMIMSLLFFYTGFNQPYQQGTFTRFFTKRAIGIELILFHVAEIVSSLLCGRLLDQKQDDSETRTNRAKTTPRTVAIICLVIFLTVNTLGNWLAFLQEKSDDGDTSSVIAMVDIESSWAEFLRPSVAFLCWGFADAQIQVYCYWLMGRIFDTHAEKFSRAVAFFQCLQSLGYTIGFYIIPTTRFSAVHQLELSSALFLLGSFLAFFQLPSCSQQ